MKDIRAVLALLRGITLPALARHRGRTLLTILGVVIGTQVVVAIGILNGALLESFARTVRTTTGDAALHVSNASAGVPDDLPEKIAAVPGVQSAAGLIAGTLTSTQGDLTVFGVDLLADQQVRETQFPRRHVHIPDPLAFVNATDSIALARPMAAALGAELGSALELEGPKGRIRLVVRGLLDPVGPAALFGGAVALTDLPTAQALFERGRLVDQIDVTLRADAEAATVRAAVHALVQGVGRVETPAEHGDNLGTMLTGIQTLLTLASFNSVIVGIFVIYHTLWTAIAHRERELALARAVGFQRRTLAGALAVEALAIGLIGAVLGIGVGVVCAYLSLDLLTGSVSTFYARIDRPAVVFTPADALSALGIGVATALVAIVAPVRRILNLSIADQLSAGRAPETGVPARRRRMTAAAGAVVVAAGFGTFFLDVRPSTPGGQLALVLSGVLAVTLGYVLLIPSALRLVLPPIKRWASLDAQFAVDELQRAGGKVTATLAAFMVAFSLVIFVSTYVRSMSTSILAWIDQTLASDLFVTPGPRVPFPSGPTLSGDLEARLRAAPGVVDVNPTRLLNVRLGDRVVLLKTDRAAAASRFRYPVVAAAGPDHRAAFADGTGVLVSENLAYRARLAAGDEIRLATPTGEHAFRIAAIVIDYTRDSGLLIIERATYERLWRDTAANYFNVWLEPGTSPDAVRAAMNGADGARGLSILTGGEFKQVVADAFESALRLTYAMEGIAILVALIAIANFFLAATLERRRAIGLLRSVAYTPTQVIRLLATEAAILGGLGGLLAVCYAVPLAILVVTRTSRIVSGWSFQPDVPVALAVATVLLGIVAAVAGAYPPARRIARGDLAAQIAAD